MTVTNLDISILQAVHSAASPLLDTIMVNTTSLGSTVGVLLITSLIGGALLWRKKTKDFLVIAISVGGASLLNVGLKLIFQRERPSLWEHLVIEQSFSFPSGHSVATSALAISLMVVCWNTRWRWPVVICGSAYMILIGFSRLYLGVHYPSDVVTSWLVGLIVVSLVSYTVYGWGKRK